MTIKISEKLCVLLNFQKVAFFWKLHKYLFAMFGVIVCFTRAFVGITTNVEHEDQKIAKKLPLQCTKKKCTTKIADLLSHKIS